MKQLKLTDFHQKANERAMETMRLTAKRSLSWEQSFAEHKSYLEQRSKLGHSKLGSLDSLSQQKLD